jgi:hypothetical protein
MGFFKDINKLQKQAKEIDKNYDSKAQLDDSLNRMKQANAMIQQQTQAAQLSMNGSPAQLQVTAARDTGTVMNMQPVLSIDLLVMPDAGAPYPVTIEQVVPVASVGRVTPGSMLRGRVDAANPSAVWVDWMS